MGFRANYQKYKIPGAMFPNRTKYLLQVQLQVIRFDTEPTDLLQKFRFPLICVFCVRDLNFAGFRAVSGMVAIHDSHLGFG